MWFHDSGVVKGKEAKIVKDKVKDDADSVKGTSIKCKSCGELVLRHPQSSGLPYCWILSEMALKMKNKELFKS